MKSWKPRLSSLAKGLLVAVALIVAEAPTLAHARGVVRLEGDWSSDRPVTLDATATPRSHAIELLADAAGWSVVESHVEQDPVDLHVKDEPASKVLGLLLPDGSFVARRTGNLVSIQPSQPGASPGPVGRADDRSVFGGELTIEKGEVVHDVAVFGGRLDVYGTVTGNLAVVGGAAEVHDGAHVQGSATVMGGEIRLDDGSVVDHDVDVVGGHVDRGLHATVGGNETSQDAPDPTDRHAGRRGRAEHREHHAWEGMREWGSGVLDSMSLSALMFLFGTVVLALGTDRSRLLRVELAARPMRTFALGLVACLVAPTVLVALCVTIVGIPVAIVALLALVVIGYAGVSAVLTTAGEALLRHKTPSSYAHLALGCVLWFLVGLVPWVGFWTHVVIGVLGLGVLVATRGAGFVPARRGPGRVLPSGGEPAY